jgi:hypothetical protein
MERLYRDTKEHCKCWGLARRDDDGREDERQPRKMPRNRVAPDHMSTEPSTIFQARVVSKLLKQTARKTGVRPARLVPRNCPSESRRVDCATSVSLRVQPFSAGLCRKTRLLLVYLPHLPLTVARCIFAIVLCLFRHIASDEPTFDITYVSGL